MEDRTTSHLSKTRQLCQSKDIMHKIQSTVSLTQSPGYHIAGYKWDVCGIQDEDKHWLLSPPPLHHIPTHLPPLSLPTHRFTWTTTKPCRAWDSCQWPISWPNIASSSGNSTWSIRVSYITILLFLKNLWIFIWHVLFSVNISVKDEKRYYQFLNYTLRTTLVTG